MRRREFLHGLAALPLLAGTAMPKPANAHAVGRVRPGDAGWPSDEAWRRLRDQVGGRLIPVKSPVKDCVGSADSEACKAVFARCRNPYYLGDEPGFTQTLGWADAWVSEPSAHAVAAETTADVVAAVNFARDNRLRLVVKGGGHSYKGASNAPDSLLVWMRRMKAIELHDAFVGAGCEGKQAPSPAASIGAGALWAEAYQEIAVKGGRYVQGGGCLTVGVAGLVLGGGFGSFSKQFGLAASSLLEAEIVTADGAARVVNACSDPELFWALKGGGGGNFGVVTRVTLATHDLPDFFGGVFAAVSASSDEAYRRLVTKIVDFYASSLANPNWGEQIAFRPGRRLELAMVFQGLDQGQAEAVWKPFFDWLRATPGDFKLDADPMTIAVPARNFWNPEFLRQVPGLVVADDRPGAPAGNISWASNAGEAGQFLHAYQSTWLPKALLATDRQGDLVDALMEATKHWGVSLHMNKGLAGAPKAAIDAARETAVHPAVVDAFALAISGAEGEPAYPGVPGFEPNLADARRDRAAVDRATEALRAGVGSIASYLSESDYFQSSWQDAYWGGNYARLLAVKEAVDPDGLFYTHHGVGSERWVENGFRRA